MAEPSLLVEAFKGLVAAGPVATVLGVFCYVLWQQNKEERAENRKNHERMLRLAVRVQRAVEVLAGLDEATSVDEALDDEEDSDDPKGKKGDRQRG